MIKVTVKPVIDNKTVVATVKKVRIFGVLVYQKMIANPPKDLKEWAYQTSI